jgi:polysaccharide biosynthesis/export protein
MPRERWDDLRAFLEHFLRKHSQELKCSAPSLDKENLDFLMAYDWLRYIRQMENLVRKMVVLGNAQSAVDESRTSRPNPALSPASNCDSSLNLAAKAASKSAERELILHALERTRWNRKRAARDLQISYKSLLYKIKQIGVSSGKLEGLGGRMIRYLRSLTLSGALLLVPVAHAQETSPQKPDASAKPNSAIKPDDSSKSAPLVAPEAEYKIGPQDVIRIDVWKEPDISRTIPVRPDGKISVPLLNDIQAAGLTAMELAASLRAGLSKFLNSPQVTVTVSEINSRRIYLTGEVSRPGALPLLPNMTVLQALASGGGFTQFARPKNIYVMRTENGKQVKHPFNYKEVVKGNLAEQNIVLQPGDVIVVP